MTTALDLRAGATALRLLAKYGATAAYYHRAGTDAYDPSTSKLTPTETQYPVKVFMVDRLARHFSREELGTDGKVSTTLACYIAGSAISFVPLMNDRIVLGAVAYRVLMAVPTYSGDQVAVWGLGIVRS